MNVTWKAGHSYDEEREILSLIQKLSWKLSTTYFQM